MTEYEKDYADMTDEEYYRCVDNHWDNIEKEEIEELIQAEIDFKTKE